MIKRNRERIRKAEKENDKRKRGHASSKITGEHPERQATENRTEPGKRRIRDSDGRGTRANHDA